MQLVISAETRTGDTPQAKRARQREKPPQMLMTTPKSLALMIADPKAARMFAELRCVIIDEIHALAGTKRGDLLALGLARLARIAPQARRVGLSATVAEPEALSRWLGSGLDAPVERIIGRSGARPEIAIMVPEARMPWAGHMGLHALPEIYAAIRNSGTTLVFVNTRAQAELIFQALWRINDDNLPIGVHHGSLAVEQRRKVEAAMAAGRLRGIVATSSLDLGVDWGAVDLVIQVGAPKGVTRLLQRIGRSNHRLDKPSRAILVPANRFEVLECRAAIEAIRERELDGLPSKPGGLDVLAQHILGMACAGPFLADDLYEEVRKAAPYAGLPRQDFDDALAFVADGGYALSSYDRFKRLFRAADGRWHVIGPRVALQYRLNVGTIVQEPMLHVKLVRGPRLGEVEEYFVAGAGGRRHVHLRGPDAALRRRARDDLRGLARDRRRAQGAGLCRRAPAADHAAVAARARPARGPRHMARPAGRGARLAAHPAMALAAAQARGPAGRDLPARQQEFPRRLLLRGPQRAPDARHAADAAHGTHRPQAARVRRHRLRDRGVEPAARAPRSTRCSPRTCWATTSRNGCRESSMLKRTFRNVAVVAGLIDRQYPGQKKTGRQVLFNSDLIYDVLRKHEPGHVLLRATRADAATGLTDVRRLGDMLARVKGRIAHRHLDRVSPLAVPVLLEIGKEQVRGAAIDSLLDEAAEELIADATREDAPKQNLLL